MSEDEFDSGVRKDAGGLFEREKSKRRSWDRDIELQTGDILVALWDERGAECRSDMGTKEGYDESRGKSIQR